jgi:two-component system cell cycle response regulator
VLKQLASAVRTRIRREDVFARYGGEEFAVILPEIDLKGARLFAEKVRQMVSKQHFTFDNQLIPVTMSVGVAMLKPAHREPADLVRAADEKLYEAKTNGRNRVCV